jgi:raffinose/stachyose/melibiose transport system permease protein
MVESRLKRWLHYLAFVLPALAAYVLFFLNPFAQGIRISFTNWDGLTPRTPISLPKGEFEGQILAKIADEGDRAFLLRVYSLDPADGQYKRLELTGSRRNRVTRILNRIAYRPEAYRYVGLRNFIDIFTGRVEERFYPRHYLKVNYNENSSLPASIPAAEFEKNFVAGLSQAERELALRFYGPAEGQYNLKSEYDEFSLEDRIWLLPEVEVSGTVPSADVDSLIAAVKEAGLKEDRNALAAAVAAFTGGNELSEASAARTREASAAIFELGELKHLLATRWVERKFDMGVVGFTLFFTFFNVLLSNILALGLALALDMKLKSRNFLRTIFFLPNVLSMIVVSLIWSFVFFNLMPRLTGIDLWMGDSAKAPWLIVMVQVWREAGYLMVIYLAGLQNIPVDVHEAALIDGASAGKKLRYVIMPLLMPAFTICLFMSLSNSLKSFDLVYAMVGPSGYAVGTVPFVMDIFFDAFAKRLAGLGTAKAMLLFLLIAALTSIQLTVMKRREVKL